LIYIAIPLGLGIDQRPTPLLALILDDLTRPLYPVKVTGDVETIYNRLDDGAWLLTVLNNRGITKPQHGILPTDARDAQQVTLTAAYDVAPGPDLLTNTPIDWQGRTATLTIPPGAARIVPIRPR
jgi:hypothetical protein